MFLVLKIITTGHPSVRIGSRHPDDVCAEQLSKKGAEIADFCWGNDATYAPALEGVKIVFCVTPYLNHWAKSFPAFLHGEIL